MKLGGFFPGLILISVLILVTFGILKYLNVPCGSLQDWFIFIGALWWLSLVTTIPWNMYFRAREVLAESQLSKERHIAVDEKDIQYTTALAKRFLVLAIFLHFLSAAFFFNLSYFADTSLGPVLSAVTLLLTLVRPFYRLYRHLMGRLTFIQSKIFYPREDIALLKKQLGSLQQQTDSVGKMLDASDGNSWLSKQKNQIIQMGEMLQQMDKRIQLGFQQNQQDHEQLAHKHQQEILNLSQDAKFLNQMRDVVNYFKNV